MLNGQKEPENVTDEAGRVLDDGYDRTPCKCIEGKDKRVQVMGLWCHECYTKLCGESRFNWADLSRTQFEVYAKANAPAR